MGPPKVEIADGVAPVQEADAGSGADSVDDASIRAGPVHSQAVGQLVEFCPVDRAFRWYETTGWPQVEHSRTGRQPSRTGAEVDLYPDGRPAYVAYRLEALPRVCWHTAMLDNLVAGLTEAGPGLPRSR